jgi:diguanylate cyclase (GGDEF)-like protein
VYSHDGIRDSLTHLVAPSLFYEELRRELSRATRAQEPISVIRFVLAQIDASLHEGDFASYPEFERHVVSFAQLLTIYSRDEDVCARMGELEFVCILHGAEEASQSFVSRISSHWHKMETSANAVTVDILVRLEAASLVSNFGESALDLLNRLDFVPLTTS